MENRGTLLEGASDMEKGAYLGAIASLATADRQATPEEVEYLTELAAAASLSEEQTQAVIKAASEISQDDVARCLDVLKTSDLKYSFVTDLIAFAKADQEYSEDEKQHVQKMAQYLGVEQKQFSLLDHFVEKTTESKATPEEISKPGFLSSLGLGDKMESAGINGSSLLKGLLGVAAPLLITGMLSRGMNRNRGFGGGGFGGGLLGGGMGGGLLGGGLGSVFGMLTGGRGMGSMGGMLGNIFGGRRGW